MNSTMKLLSNIWCEYQKRKGTHTSKWRSGERMFKKSLAIIALLISVFSAPANFTISWPLRSSAGALSLTGWMRLKICSQNPCMLNVASSSSGIQGSFQMLAGIMLSCVESDTCLRRPTWGWWTWKGMGMAGAPGWVASVFASTSVWFELPEVY